MDLNEKMKKEAKELDAATLMAQLFVSQADFNFAVEGLTDKQFYKQVLVPSQNDESYEFFNAQKEKGKDDESYLVGQEAVIDACRRYSDLNRKQPKKKCAFIIDYDFDCLSLYGIEYLKGITTTKPVHSIEGFFLVDENISKVFEYVGIPGLLPKFNKACKAVLNDLVEFYALRSTITYANSKKDVKPHACHYDKKYLDEYIFAFSFKEGEVSFVRPFYEEEVAKMHLAIEGQEILAKEYEKRKKRFKKIFQLKGKTVFALLDAFLRHQKCEVQLKAEEEFDPKVLKLLTVNVKPDFI